MKVPISTHTFIYLFGLDKGKDTKQYKKKIEVV